jgi:hypothetical protein
MKRRVKHAGQVSYPQRFRLGRMRAVTLASIEEVVASGSRDRAEARPNAGPNVRPGAAPRIPTSSFAHALLRKSRFQKRLRSADSKPSIFSPGRG